MLRSHLFHLTEVNLSSVFKGYCKGEGTDNTLSDKPSFLRKSAQINKHRFFCHRGADGKHLIIRTKNKAKGWRLRAKREFLIFQVIVLAGEGNSSESLAHLCFNPFKSFLDTYYNWQINNVGRWRMYFYKSDSAMHISWYAWIWWPHDWHTSLNSCGLQHSMEQVQWDNAHKSDY